MNKHCKGETNESGICPTCGDIMNGDDNRCHMEIYNEAIKWGKHYDKFLVVALAVVAVYGFGKAFNIW